MNKNIYIFLFLILVFGGILTFIFLLKKDKVNNFEECVAAGYSVLASYPRQCKTLDNRTFIEDIGNELEKINLIKIDNPRPNQLINNPLFINGKARGFWFFEADFPIKLFDDNNFLLGVSQSQALNDWMTEDFVPFEATLSFAEPSTQKGKLILEKNNPSGLLKNFDQLIIPVYFKKASTNLEKLMTVKIFLSDSRFMNEPHFDCSRTIAVERKVPKTQEVSRAAIEALLRGATQEEINQGFISNINPGTRIKNLTIENKVAKIDFNERLGFQVGGSCRVTAIRAEITETLKQFPNIKEVIISINGETEDILQP